MKGGYKTIIADPAWPEYGGGRITRGAQRHYPLMTIEQIEKLPVKKIAADNSHLYLWTTSNHAEDAHKIMKAWGFRYVNTIPWIKAEQIPNGTQPKFQLQPAGLGQYYRGQNELLLFGVRGNLPYKCNDGTPAKNGFCKTGRAQERNIILAPRREHSQKPEQGHEYAERISYSPRVELFAREKREGWDAWGLEAPQ